jgi:hypothetical protein
MAHRLQGSPNRADALRHPGQSFAPDFAPLPGASRGGQRTALNPGYLLN